MSRFFWFVIFCTACKAVDATITECPWNITREFCGVKVPGSSCDLKTRCNVNICEKSRNKTDCTPCKVIVGNNKRNNSDPDIKSIVKYNQRIYYTENGKIRKDGKIMNTGLENVYPVLWGNSRLLFINKTQAYELHRNNNSISKASVTCSKDHLTGFYYFQPKKLESARPQKGLMAGGTKIEIDDIYENFKPIMEPMNKTCSNPYTKNNKSYCFSPEVDSKRANLTFISDNKKYFFPFEYLENPAIELKGPNSSYYWGKRRLEFQGKYISHINIAELSYSSNINISSKERCSLKNNTIECLSPRITTTANSSDSSKEFTLVLKMDTYAENITLDYYTNPQFNEKALMEDHIIEIKGKRLDKAANDTEYEIKAGTECCTVQILESNRIQCYIQNADIKGSINVTLHSETKTLVLEKHKHKVLYYLVPVIILLMILVVILVLKVWYRGVGQRRTRRHYTLTSNYSGQLMSIIVRQGIPFQKPSDYIKRILWTHKPPGNIRYDTQNMSENLKQNLEQFGHLLKNKYFLLPTLKALEKNKSLTQDHKFTYSYHLSLLFSSDLRYFLELCEELFVHLVSQNKGSKSKKLMLSCSSITEYMILNWLGISMYSYMKENIGDLLYFFTHDLKSYLEKMPIDEVTGNTYQCLFDKYRLKKNTQYEEIQIQAEMRGVIEIVPVFTCDSIVQLKKKCLAAFYRGQPFSEIPDIDDIRVETNRIQIEEFKREETSMGFTHHLTIDNWNIEEDDLLRLIFAKVPQVAEANADDRYTTLGSPVARITTKSNRRFMHIQEPQDSKTEQSLTKMDLKKINLSVSLEYKLMQLIYKFLDSKHKCAPQSCLYNLFKKAAQKDGEEKTWILNSYFMQFCCQFIAEPNILLDINQELYTKKNLEGMKNYTAHIMERCLREPSKDPELSRNLTGFLSEFSRGSSDITELMSTLQNISDDIMRDVSFSKEHSLYYIFKMMKTNYSLINSALMKEEKACRLLLGEKFVSIIEQIEIGQTKRNDRFSP